MNLLGFTFVSSCYKSNGDDYHAYPLTATCRIRQSYYWSGCTCCKCLVNSCLAFCLFSISTTCRVFKMFFLLSQIMQRRLMLLSIITQLHWLTFNYCYMFKTATLVYKFLLSGFHCYFEPFLSLSSCSCSIRHRHPNPQYLNSLPLHTLQVT